MKQGEIDNHIQDAERFIDRTLGDRGLEYGTTYTGLAIANALLAIAGELRRMNDRADIENDRDDLRESTKIWGS